MPPKKRTVGPARRSKRHRPLPPASDLPETDADAIAAIEYDQPPPAQLVSPTQPSQEQGMVQINLQALTSMIAAAVSEAVKDAMAAQQQESVPGRDQDRQVQHVVDAEIATVTRGTQDPNLSTLGSGDQPRQLFTSIGVNLDAWVSDKTKAKIWSNEYIDFGALLSVAPPREKYPPIYEPYWGYFGSTPANTRALSNVKKGNKYTAVAYCV